jgi:hypothetical protein
LAPLLTNNATTTQFGLPVNKLSPNKLKLNLNKTEINTTSGFYHLQPEINPSTVRKQPNQEINVASAKIRPNSKENSASRWVTRPQLKKNAATNSKSPYSIKIDPNK